MAERVRGVILAPHAHTAGAVPRIAQWLADGLIAGGWDVEVWPWGKRADDEGIAEKLVARTRDVKALARKVRAHRPEFLVIKSGLDWKSVSRDIALVRAVRSTVPTIILHPHGSRSERLAGPGHVLFKRAVRVLLGRVDAVFVLSSEERETLLGFAPTAAVEVVENPYDPDCLGTRDRVLEPNRFRVLFVGRLVEEKGVLELVRAAADTDGRGALDVAIVGEGPIRAAAENLAAELSVIESVRFAGALSGDALAAEFAHADVLALPSYSEGFPTVVAEAMGFGLPVVSTRIRGMRDHLTDGVNALFVDVADPTDLRAKLLALRDAPEMARAMGAANYEAVGKFSPSNVAERYRSAIERVRSGG